MLCAVCCVLCAVCCVLCAVCCVLCAVCCVLCAVCCVLCAVCCVALLVNKDYTVYMYVILAKKCNYRDLGVSCFMECTHLFNFACTAVHLHHCT